MTTAKSIINLGLSKIGNHRVNEISPPVSPLERHCADGYPQWRDSELSKRMWHFALVQEYQLTQAGTPTAAEKRRYAYRYALPNDHVRVIRRKYDRFGFSSGYLLSGDTPQYIMYIQRVPEANFDPLFVEVLAARVAVECNGIATSGAESRSEAARRAYKEALDEAGRQNAWLLPEELNDAPEDLDAWQAGRQGWVT